MSDVKLHHVEAGRGLPVVLLHGFPLSNEIWDQQRKALSEHYRVITPDLRGHGKSPVTADVYTMDLLAGDVFTLLDSLGIKQAVIMGHSMGGYVALAGWKRSPERFLGLGLIASQAGADTDEARANRYKLADKVSAEGSAAVADAMAPRLFAASSPAADRVRRIMLNTTPEGIVGALKGMAVRADSAPLLAAINVPLLVLAGDADKIIPLDKAKAMVAAAPNGTLATIEGAGHMPMLERPEAVTAALLAFLGKIEG